MSTQYQQIQILSTQNERLLKETGRQLAQIKKLKAKYEKSLKQLALIVKANQTIKHDYDQLQLKMDRVVFQKTQTNKKNIKEYVKKELDEFNQTKHKLNQQNVKLQMQNNSLTIKVNSLELEKSKLGKEKQELGKKYEILKSQLNNIDPETRDDKQYNKNYELKQKSRLVDELQEAVQTLQKQKNQIQQQFQSKLRRIQKLWQQLHEFQQQINRQYQIKLELPSSENQEKGAPYLNKRRRGSIIYSQGVKLIQQSSKKNGVRTKHPKVNYAQHQQIQQINKRLMQLQRQNVLLRQSMSGIEDSQKVINELRSLNTRLTQQKMIDQQKFEQLRVQKVITDSRVDNQGLMGRLLTQLNPKNVSNQQDLFSVLKSLHQQLTPLRRQLLQLKKEQTQKKIISSNDKANCQVKMMRLQKQLSFYKQHNQLVKMQLRDFKSQKQRICQLLKQKKELQQHKNILEGRVVVMQSLNITDRTRVGSETYNTLKQFEKRIQLLIQDPNILKDLQGNHLQQLIAMKAYILQLDQRLKEIGVQNQKLMKKYSYSKQKICSLNIQIKQTQNRQMTKILMYKQKIQAYDKLVDKLTRELERNLSRNQNNCDRNQSISSEMEFNQVMNLYEQKMMSMGQQIVRIRKDKQNYEVQLKDLQLQLTKNTRQLNDRQGDIVVLKTSIINLQNYKSNLDKQLLQLRIQNQFYKQNKEYKGQSLQKSRFISMLEQQNHQIRNRYEQEHERMRQIYQNQIALLKKNLSLFERAQHNPRYDNYHNQIRAQIYQQQLPQGQVRRTKEEQVQAQIGKLTSKYEKDMEQANLNYKKANLNFQKAQQQKGIIILQLQSSISSLVQKIKENQLQSKGLEQLIKQKASQLKRLEEIIFQKDCQISNLCTQIKRKAQNEHSRTQQSQQYCNQNSRIRNQIYQKDIRISGLESTVYNLKLEKQRMKSEYQIIQGKLSSIESDLKTKNAKIFHSKNDVRYSADNYDSTLMAKDSLLRSYQNQIKNLMYTIEDLRNRNKSQKEQQQSRIRDLQQQIRSKYVSRSHIYNQENKLSPSLSQKAQIQGYKSQIQQLNEDVVQKQKAIQQLRQETANLSSQLNYTRSDLQIRSKQVNNPEPRIPGLHQVNSHTPFRLQQELQSVNSQVLILRANILTLKDQIQLKESMNSRLKHQIYILKLQNKRLQKYELDVINDLKKQNSDAEINYPVSQPHQPCMYKQNHQNQALLNQIRSQLDQLKAVNQELIFNESQHIQTISFLSEKVQILSQELRNQKTSQNQVNNEMIEQLQRLRRIENNSQSQRCRLMAGRIQNMQKGIQQLKREYQDQLNDLKSKLKITQKQLFSKDYKITQLSQTHVQSTLSAQNQINVTQLSPEITYLANQIQRLNLINDQKQKQLSDANILVTKLQSQQHRYSQKLGLMFLLNVQIQSLRSQLNQKQTVDRKQLQQVVQRMRMNRVSSVQGLVDFQLIKQLECSHQHLADYEKLMPQVRSHLNIDDMRTAQVTSYPSQSLLSNNNIGSDNSIQDPFKKYYRHAKSTYNQKEFSPQSPSHQPQTVNADPLILGSLRKISESHNIESSYGSSLQQSSQAPRDNYNHGLRIVSQVPQQNYSYTLTNVNMISSVGCQGDDSSKVIIHPQVSQSALSINQYPLIQDSNVQRNKGSASQTKNLILQQTRYLGSSNRQKPSANSFLTTQQHMNQSPNNTYIPSYSSNKDFTTDYNSSVLSNTGYNSSTISTNNRAISTNNRTISTNNKVAPIQKY